TLLSSQGTDASFVLTHRTFSGAFLRALPFGVSFILAFPTLSDLSGFPFRSDFLGAFQVFAFAFSFPADPTLSEVFSRSDRLSFPIHRGGFSMK
ncbi:hypothetical protein, partial [Streptomyces alboflavus]|uniref:hypothetical protein n=1 Tax=Streptomyces alboflavus TaxID=67267 RepID=UPI0036BD799A